jgi:hypothetical protein
MTESDDMIGMVLMPRGNVQEMLDIIVGSLDYGSGVLDQQQIEALRAAAELLGLDPMSATPSEYSKSYPHVYKAYFNTRINKVATVCKWCSGPSDAPWHLAEAADAAAGVDLSERDED